MTGSEIMAVVGFFVMLLGTVSGIWWRIEGLMDDKLPHRKMAEVELADAIIRIFDLAGVLGYDLGGAVVEKSAYNTVRPDHQLGNRMIAGGKAY